METPSTLTAPAAEARLALVYDSETSGIPLWKEPSGDPRQPHIVGLAGKVVNLDTREILHTMDVIIRPDGWGLSPEVVAVHGITMERAMGDVNGCLAVYWAIQDIESVPALPLAA